MQAYEALLATHADQESRWQAMVSAKDGDIARLAVELRRVRGEAADLRARNLRLERTVAKAAPNQRRLALRFTRLEAELATLRAERASGTHQPLFHLFFFLGGGVLFIGGLLGFLFCLVCWSRARLLVLVACR